MKETPGIGRTGGFGREHRLRRGRSFDLLFRDGQCLAGRTAVMRVVPGEASHSRCGVIASKRTFRRAVDRNRAKRLLREAFRQERDRLPIVCDVVLVARRKILDDGVSAVCRDLRKLSARMDWSRYEGEA